MRVWSLFDNHLEGGRIVSEGTYDELLSASEQFRAMARIPTEKKPSVSQGF